MPRNFVSVLYGMPLPANVTCGNNGFLFCVVWKDITTVFSVFTTRLFSVNHVCISVITLFSLYWRSFIFPPDTNMFVSSANNNILVPVIFRDRSASYKIYIACVICSVQLIKVLQTNCVVWQLAFEDKLIPAFI